jgi:WhiB family redox-sensing transcriptional regulator
MTAMTSEPFAWQARAACRYTDPDLFFPEGDPAAAPNIAQTAEAKAVCSSCPVRRQCAEYAVGETFGTWGGITEAERRAARRRSFGRERRTA